MLLSNSLWHSFCRACDTFSHIILHFQLTFWCIKGKSFVACDGSLQGLTERFDRFETIKLYNYKSAEKLILQNILLSLIYTGDFGGNVQRGGRWCLMQSFSGPFHSKIT